MKKLIVAIIIVMFIQYNALAYDSDNVHQEINKNIVLAASALNGFLQKLGYERGARDELNINHSKKIFEYFMDGGMKEDNPLTRAFNHFHDPLQVWNRAGYKNGIGISSAVWAQNQAGALGGEWSWAKARDYYYRAFRADNDELREEYLAKTFRTLGHLMHLIADVSVPEHVRDDTHVMPGLTYESWAQSNSDNLPYEILPVNRSIFSRSVDYQSAVVPISALWDQDIYDGSNPFNGQVGLAEFTNANFFSKDTIFADYPHPTRDMTTANLVEQTAEDGSLDKVWYIQGYTSSKLAAYSYLRKYLIRDQWAYNLDDDVYEDYSIQLVPKAVGYSNALLDYFFRGEIEAFNAMLLKNIEGEYRGAKLSIKNNTINDVLGYGEVYLSYAYITPGSDDRIFGISFVRSRNEEIGPYAESVNEYEFDFINNIPSNAEEINFWLVYKGRLGSEDGSIIISRADIRPFPMAGLIKKMARGYSKALIYRISEVEIKPYYVEVPSLGYMIAVAFDEGSIDIVRVLWYPLSGENEIITNLYTYLFNEDLDKYELIKAEEVDRSPPATSYDLNELKYVRTKTTDSNIENHTYNYIIEELIEVNNSIIDFFVPINGELWYLKRIRTIHHIREPFTTKSATESSRSWGIGNGETCSYSGIINHELIDRDKCHVYGEGSYSSEKCGKDSSFDESGWCTELQSFLGPSSYWQTCDNTRRLSLGINHHTMSIWSADSVEYGNSKVIAENPFYEYNRIWQRGEEEPCINLKGDVIDIFGSNIGKIVSDQSFVSNRYVKSVVVSQGPFEDINEIYPEGITLDGTALIYLRQTGNYSILEFHNNGDFHNINSYSPNVSTTPILVNKEGSGFRVILNHELLCPNSLHVGMHFNEHSSDFDTIGTVRVCDIKPEEIYDVMVEYYEH
ncbi:MAG: hypothetical protein JSV21_04385 [Nitrospirota bacterium]|nr:MAG: hypothetical protein JSV21_04385 [Nitrospirota bacterium]